MAEIQSQTGDNRRKGAVRRSKKQSTKVDLTPMVDLGFLLITFFILTTTWSEKKAMRFIMPKDESDMPVAESTALTLIPIGSDRIFYYHGEPSEALAQGSFGLTNYNLDRGIGEIIRKKQQQLGASAKFTSRDLMLVIKPAEECSYKNLVDVMDEVLINDVKHYAVVDLTAVEKALVQKYTITAGNDGQ